VGIIGAMNGSGGENSKPADKQSDHETYLKSGINGIITKPLNIKTVVSQIREIIADFSG